jgi:flagellar basal body-associated protein FliL
VSSHQESDISSDSKQPEKEPSRWFRIALLTAASAAAGGLATAWFYRKTLTKLRENGENSQNPHFGIPAEEEQGETEEEI